MKRGKRYNGAREGIDRDQAYGLDEAITLLKKAATAKFDEGVDIAIRQASEADMSVGIMAAEIHQPVIVDAEHLNRRFRVLHLRGRSENAEDDFRINAVAFHFLQPQMRVRGALDALLTVGEHAGLGHLVDTLVLARHQFDATRPNTIQQPEIRALVRHPLRAVRPVRDIGHAVLHLGGGFGDKQLRRHPRHIQMAICGNSTVFHG